MGNIYTVNYIKPSSFLKDARLKQQNSEGEIVTDTRYVKPSIPKATRGYVPHISYKTGKFLINLDQAELNGLVKEIGLYDNNDQLIETAPLGNPNAPFWKHPALRVNLDGSGSTFNEDNPMDKFWLKCFEKDPRFKFKGEGVAPSIAARVEYNVTKVTDQQLEDKEQTDETFKAMKLLVAIEDDYEKSVQILRAMGTDVRTPNPSLVKNALTRKITEYKDQYVMGTSERNIEMFIRMAGATSAQLAIQDIISTARRKHIIQKDSSNHFIYGEIRMGTSLKQLETFLNDTKNIEILNEINTKIKD